MARILFTENLKRHIDCAEQQAAGDTVAEVLSNAFADRPKLKGYVLDDQNRLRRHMLISVDGEMVKDRIYLTDPVSAESEIYIIQALSGG